MYYPALIGALSYQKIFIIIIIVLFQLLLLLKLLLFLFYTVLLFFFILYYYIYRTARICWTTGIISKNSLKTSKKLIYLPKLKVCIVMRLNFCK